MEEFHFDETIKDIHYVADLTVINANVFTDSTKERMQGKYWASVYLDDQGNKKTPDQVQVDETEFYIQYRILPALACCTTGTILISGVEVSWKDYEVFKLLPPELFIQWRNMVMQKNPYLFGISESISAADKEKKI